MYVCTMESQVVVMMMGRLCLGPILPDSGEIETEQ